MAQKKKEIKSMNVCLDKSLHEEFEVFCEKMGQSKTKATEMALKMYMKRMNEVMKELE